MSEMNNGMNNEMENNIITFQDEDGNDVDLEIIDAFELNETQYVALVLAEEPAEEQEEEVFIMRIEEDEDGDDVLIQVTDEGELEAAFEHFKERMADEYEIIDD